MAKLVGRWVSYLIAAFLGAALWIVVYGGMSLKQLPKGDISYAEFTSIILTALGVILAAFALLVGVLAVVGWASFQRHVAESAANFLKEEFKETGPRYRKLVEEVKEAAIRESYAGVGQDVPVEDENEGEG